MTGFAETARRAAGVACGVLGWRADDFWAATPADLLIVIAAWQPAMPDALGRVELTELMKRDTDGRRT